MKSFRGIFVVILICLISIVPVSAALKENNSKIVLIDPGHGGFDGGAKSKAGTIEKNINLNISLKLKENLEEKGYTVYLTREGDEDLFKKGSTLKEKKREDLKRRCKLKKETKCDIFVSIHQNTFPQSKCYGAQVWYASNDVSEILANSIQNSLREVIKDNNKRQCKAAGEAYAILRDKYEGASVLVECGFLSNPEEDVKLNTEKHQNDLVEGISLGIDRYLEELNKKK